MRKFVMAVLVSFMLFDCFPFTTPTADGLKHLLPTIQWDEVKGIFLADSFSAVKTGRFPHFICPNITTGGRFFYNFRDFNRHPPPLVNYI